MFFNSFVVVDVDWISIVGGRISGISGGRISSVRGGVDRGISSQSGIEGGRISGISGGRISSVRGGVDGGISSQSSVVGLRVSSQSVDGISSSVVSRGVTEGSCSVGAGRGTIVLTVVLRPIELSFSLCFSLRFSLGLTFAQMTDSRHIVNITVKSVNLRGNKLLLMVKSVNVRGESLVLTVKSVNLRCDKLLLVVKTINLGLVDLVEGLDCSIGDGFPGSKSGLKNREKIKSGCSRVWQDMSGKFGCPVSDTHSG